MKLEAAVLVLPHIESSDHTQFDQHLKVTLSGQLGLTFTFFIISAVQEKNILLYRDTILNLKQKAHGNQTGNM